jgi:hypothetical protein
LKRWIFIVPVMTPKLSSYWLYFVTSISYSLAQNLVDSMKVNVLCRKNTLAEELGIQLLKYEDAIALAFDKIEQNQVVSSWIDALGSDILDTGIASHIQVPEFGCFKDAKTYKPADVQKALLKIWKIGGETGWYYADRLWDIRGFLDKLLGGVGTRRGRKNPVEIGTGDALDFWRVLLANKQEKRLLLYAEMKLPGEAWLEFRIDDDNVLHQTATFRPHGLAGRLYWYSLLPFHVFIFKGMIRNICK